MAGEGTSAYDFDPEKQAATMLIQIVPRKYIKINQRLYHPTKGTVIGADGKNRISWDYKSNAQVWVPPEIGNQLIKTEPHDSGGPIATLLKTRTKEEAMPTKKAKKVDADTADGTNKVENVATVKDVEKLEGTAEKKRRKPDKFASTSIPVLDDMPYNQLQTLAAEKGIKSFGTKKAELIAALKEKNPENYKDAG